MKKHPKKLQIWKTRKSGTPSETKWSPNCYHFVMFYRRKTARVVFQNFQGELEKATKIRKKAEKSRKKAKKSKKVRKKAAQSREQQKESEDEKEKTRDLKGRRKRYRLVTKIKTRSKLSRKSKNARKSGGQGPKGAKF